MTVLNPSNRVAEVFGFEGRLVRIVLEEGPVDVMVDWNKTEHTRRHQLGLGPITDRSGIIRLSQVSDRCAGPPATITAAMAKGRTLRVLLGRVGQLSAVAPMAVMVATDIDPTDPALLDAGLYGIGVAAGPSEKILTFPAPVEPVNGWFPWWVSELAYAAALNENERRQAAGPAHSSRQARGC